MFLNFMKRILKEVNLLLSNDEIISIVFRRDYFVLSFSLKEGVLLIL